MALPDDLTRDERALLGLPSAHRVPLRTPSIVIAYLLVRHPSLVLHPRVQEHLKSEAHFASKE